MTGFPQAPANPLLDREHLRQLAAAINRAMQGKTNNTATVTLTPSAASTAVTDVRVSATSVILLMPKTANAGAVNYHIIPNTGTFTIYHANNAQTDKDFAYAVIA